MAAKKKPAKKKVAGKRKSAAKRSAPKKKAAAKKPKPAAKKKAAAAAPAKAAPKAPPVAAAPKPMPRPTPAPAPAPPASTGEFTGHDVNRGHIFSLHPKVNTTFSPQAFDNARRELAEQRFATIEDAARAVAERALDLTHQRPARDPFPTT